MIPIHPVQEILDNTYKHFVKESVILFYSYYPTAWILTSVDPLIYAGSGTINNGDFTGLVASTIQTQINVLVPLTFWGNFGQDSRRPFQNLMLHL